MKVLVDSSVWVGHFKQRNEHLVGLLEQGWVMCHPYVVAEVACGTPPARKVIVSMLAQLDCAPVATQDELLTLLDTQKLFGRGCGFVDISLIASVLLSEKVQLWTLDKRLDALAAELGHAYRGALHS
jgi:predicted nucleic acid-binding protein